MSPAFHRLFLLDSRLTTVLSFYSASQLKILCSTILTFSNQRTIYIKTTKTMRRQYRDLRDDTKMRIAQSLKGRSFSDSHKQAISDAMKAYWSTIPYRDEENNESNNQDNETSM
jgi:hypothetical protein